MYSNLVALKKSDMSNLAAPKIDDYSFSKGRNAIPLVVPEFSMAASAFPIVFIETSSNDFVPVALTGLKDKENVTFPPS